MDQIPNKIKNIINKYIAVLNKNDFPIEKAVLYGSYAKGTFKKHSDIDIALVSNSFDGVRFIDRNKIMKITLEISKDLEPMPFTPNDFTTENPFVQEILNTGVVIK